MALEPVLIAMRGDTGTALARGLAHWQVIGAGHHFAAGALANVISYCLMLEGDFARARQFCAEARACNEQIGSALGLGYALSVSGLIEAVQGNLELALQQFGEVDKMAALPLRQPWFEATHVKMASVGLIASVLLETDRLDEADELLQRYAPLVMRQPSADMSLLCHLVHARLKLAQGDAGAAHAILDGADHQIAASWQFARARHLLESERIRIDLAGGERARALARADALERLEPAARRQGGKSFVEEWCGAGIETARLAIARGQAGLALARLDEDIAGAQAAGRRWRLLKLLLLRTLALDALQDVDGARAALAAALALGWRIGARRSFADEGERLGTLLAQLPPRRVAQLDQGAEVAAYWRGLRGERAAPAAPAAVLSERERTILRLLATGMGNEKLAATVFLSVNTVKWHIRRILEKLDARNRSEAAFIARQLGLLDP